MEENVHIIPLGYEIDRVVKPFEGHSGFKANRAYLISTLEGVDAPVPVIEKHARFVEVVPMYYSSIIELLGGGSEEQIAARMWEVSPVEHLPLGKPLVIINGELDPYVPLLLAEEYMELAAAAGDDVKLITLKGAGHFESADPADPVTGPAIRQAVLSIMGLFPSGKRK